MDANELIWEAYLLGLRIAHKAYCIKHTKEGSEQEKELLQQIANGEMTFIDGIADFDAKYPFLSSGPGVVPTDQVIHSTNNRIKEGRELAQRIVNQEKEFWGVD